jgi:hypothetical protein
VAALNEEPHPSPLPEALLRAVPVAVLVGFAWALAWDKSGSIRASDWLPYAAGAALVLAAVLLAGAAQRPEWMPLASTALLAAFGVWTIVSTAWSPLPSLARDEGLLILLYAIAFVTPLVTLRSSLDRLAAMGVVVVGLTALTLATAVRLRTGGNAELLYFAGRLDYPVTYWNGEAAIALVAFWPAIVLAAKRAVHPLLRSVALGGATAMLALWLGTQSKGGGVALGCSAIVFFAVTRERSRTLLPTVVAAGLAAAGAHALTHPFRADGDAFTRAVRDAGETTIVLAAIAAGIGLLYALVDRRLRVPARVARATSIALGVLVVAAVLSGVGAFFASVDHPIRSTQDRWEQFKHLDSGGASSHFGQLGSNRYDFWRVALDEVAKHPAAGVGGRGWLTAYRLHGRSDEQPVRSHSLELDALSETGVIGALLLLSSGILALIAVGRGARRSLIAAGALGTAAYFTVHTGGDWVWTIPAVGLPAFVIVGIGAASDRAHPLPTRAALPTGVVALLVAIFAFVPPWLSSRLVDRAYGYDTAAGAASDLRWARRLDPLAVEPLIAESALSRGAAAIPPLKRAVKKQPRDSELYFLLGRAYLDAGRKADARRELRIAVRMSPRNETIRRALAEAR